MEPSQKRQCTPIAKLRTLNEQYALWIQQQLATAPEDLWIEAAEDYIQHARNCLQEASGSSQPSARPTTHSQTANGQSEAPPAGLLWGAKTSLPDAAPAATSAPGASVFSRLGAAGKRPGPGPSLPPLFPQPSPVASLPQPPFSFQNLGPSSTAASGSPPSLPAPAVAAAPPGLFSFAPVSSAAAGPSNTTTGGVAWSTTTGANGSSIAGSSPQAGDEDEQQDALKEEKSELRLAAGAEVLFKETAKLHIQKPGTTDWVDKGRGTLTVRANSQPEGSGTSASTQVVFTLDTGRVLVNGALYKGLSITKAKKPNMVLTRLTLASEDMNEEQGAPADLQMVLFKLAASDRAASFIAIVQEAVPK